MLQTTHPRAIPEILAQLRATPAPAAGVLSVNLATPPERVLGQSHLLMLRDLFKETRETIAANDRKSFETARERVERYLAGEWEATQYGVAVFASADPEYFFAVALPFAPEDRASWAAQPHIAELQFALDEFERVAVALVDKEHARLYTIFMGEIEEQIAFEDYVPGKQATGGWYALAQGRIARHHEEQVLRHVHHVCESLQQMLQAHPFSRLLVAGPDEALTLLREHLPEPLRQRLAGTLELELFASDANVLAATLETAASVERRMEWESVIQLLEANSRFTAIGVPAVLDALSGVRVHALMMEDQFVGQGSECSSCHRLWAVKHLKCPVCQAPVTPVPDLRERVIERALDQDAQVDLVTGEAAERLREVGGLAAWTRY